MQLSPDASHTLRDWLEEDPIGNAFVIHRAFYHPERSEIFVDEESKPRSVVVLQPENRRLALASSDLSTLRMLLEDLPPGKYHLSSVDLDLMPALRDAMKLEPEEPVWLFRTTREEFRPYSTCETRPVDLEDARMVAEHWWLEGDAYDYVRSRIEVGPSEGVYVDGHLVAWDMTHFETDKVVMLGFLHVKEEYRGRGYAKTVTSAMCKRVLDGGKVPICQVFVENEPSMRLTESMGFKRVKQQVWGEGVKE